MPLVRIDLQQGRTPDQLRQLADTVQGVMLDVFAAPARDRYQVITEHPVGHILVEDTNLGLERSDGVTVIQIFQQGRTTVQKQAAYHHLAQRLDDAGLVRPADLIVTVSTNEPCDWSFGLGRAQFLTGEL